VHRPELYHGSKGSGGVACLFQEQLSPSIHQQDSDNKAKLSNLDSAKTRLAWGSIRLGDLAKLRSRLGKTWQIQK